VDTNKKSSYLWLCFFLGWAFIIRPTNILVIVFLPFLFPSFKAFANRLGSWVTERKLSIILGLLVFGAFVTVQMIMVHDQSNEWKLNTYTNEGFDNWRNPEIWNLLFSWRKGLFIYTPILLLLLPGVIVLYRKNSYMAVGFLLFFSLCTYVFASWWCWWYGGGLGMRVYIDFMSILFIPIVFLFQYIRIYLKIVFVCFFGLCTWMYQVYEFQMVNNILHYDNMNYEQFRYVFMKKDLRFSWMFHLTYDTLPQNAQKLSFQESFFVNGKPLLPSKVSFNGEDYQDNPIIGFTMKKHGLDTLDTYFGAKLELDLRILTSASNPNFLIQYFKNDTVRKQANIFMGPQVQEVGKWTQLKFDMDSKLKCNEFDSLSIIFLEGNTVTDAKGFKASFYLYR
jgi:hypothetical protein